MSVRQSARDTQRKNDLKQLQNALELFKLDQNPQQYPDTAAFLEPGMCWTNTGTSSSCGSSTPYIKKIPGDPLKNQSVPYFYQPNGQFDYTLAACLENKADKQGTTCPGGFSCASQWCLVSTAP